VVRDIVADLFVAAECREWDDRIDERSKALERKTTRGACHVGFSDTHVEEASWIAAREIVEELEAEIRGEKNNPRVVRSRFSESTDESVFAS